MDLKQTLQLKQILLIEDNFEIRDNISEMLSFENYNVLLASNGEEGIELAKRKLPDLVLCDIVMQEITGYQVLAELKRNPSTSDIPFIFITASVEKKEVEAATQMGAAGYIFKPFEWDEVIGKIDLCLRNDR